MKQKSLRRVSIFDFPLVFLQQSNYTFTPLAIFIVPSTGNAVMENKIKSAMEIEGESGNYLQIASAEHQKKSGGSCTAWKAMGAMAQQTWGKL